MKKIVALLVLCLLVGLVPVQALAAGYDEDVTYISWWVFLDGEYVENDIDYTNLVYVNKCVEFSHPIQARYGDRISATPRSGYKIVKMEYFLPDDERPNACTQNGSAWSFILNESNLDIKVFVEKDGAGGNPSLPQGPSAEPGITVTFDANEGTCATGSDSVNAQNKLARLPVASRNGFVFAGWFTARTGGERVTTDTVFIDDTTVYAHWVKAIHSTNPETNDFAADIDENKLTDPQIVNMLVTDEDLAKGEDIRIFLTVKEEKESDVAADDREAILKKAGNDEIAAYLNIQLFKQIGTDAPSLIRNTKDNVVPITMQIPSELIPENAAKGSFYIIYRHDHQTKKINANFDVASGKLSFNASEFSPYALVYSTLSAGSAQYDLPRTGDDASLYIWALMLLCSTAAMAVLLLSRKKT